MRTHRRALLAAFLLLGVSTPAQAQARPVDLAAATIEDLMNIEITSASRKEQRLADVPAAISVTLSAGGQNLLDPVHAEFAGVGAIVTPTLVPRSARVQLAWRY